MDKIEGRYILLTDPRFVKESIKEIDPVNSIREKRRIDKYTWLISSEGELPKDKKYVFTYSLMDAIDVDLTDTASTASEISKHLPKGISFRIFLLDALSNIESNRDVEIKIGSIIESEDHPVDLENPGCAALLISCGEKSVFGISRNVYEIYAIHTIFRPRNKKAIKYISRAEQKLEEAINYFGIDLSKVKRCIDVGSAPGGWSDMALRNGKVVIGIDKGYMDYLQLRRYGGITIMVDKEEKAEVISLVSAIDPNINVCTFDEIEKIKEDRIPLIQIKTNSSAVALNLLQGLDLEMLMIDSNTHYTESTSIAIAFSKFLRNDGYLILTLKINNRKPLSAIDYATSKLKGTYTGIMIKKLVKNRSELTLFAQRSF